jgi:hypothetical protein
MNRPSNLQFADRLTEQVGGARIWLKREDLNHTGYRRALSFPNMPEATKSIMRWDKCL